MILRGDFLFMIIVFRILTFPFFILYKLITKIRFFYIKKYRPIEIKNQYIIGIGNISLGGTGKTPSEIFLLSLLKGKANIVLRGYKRKTNIDILGFGKNLVNKYSVEDIGDEPYMIMKNFPDTYFIITNQKEKALLKYNDLPYFFTIIDDAFHKFKIKQNLKICVIDAINPFDNFYTIPWGRLRHDVRELELADIFWISRANYVSNQKLHEIRDYLLKFNKKIIVTNFEIDCLVNNNSERLDFLNLKNKRIFAFSGIGNFESFKINFKLILKFKKIKFLKFRDHYNYSYKDFHMLSKISKKFDIIITTEKDFYKIIKYGQIEKLFYFKMNTFLIHL